MITYYLGLGANTSGPRGTPRETLAWAVERIAALGGVRASAVAVTRPMHRERQPDYANQVLELTTSHAPTSLHRATGEIEDAGGRNRPNEERYGPRPLDIDILLAGDLVIASPWLTVPHPRMHLRPFVLEPLVVLAPGLLDPRTKAPWAEYLARPGSRP